MSYQDDYNRDAPPPLPPERNAYDDPLPDNRDRYAPPQQAGCSKGCMYAMAGCGCMTVLAMIGLALGAWKLFNIAKDSMSMDPAVIKTTTQKIADLEPPKEIKPRFKMEFFFMTMVIYASDDGDSQFSLMQIDQKWVPNEQERQDAQRQFRNNPQAREKRRLEIVKSEQREMKLRGQDAKVTFAEAKDSQDGKEFEVIKGTFQGKAGPVEFELQLPKEKYKEADVVEFLESIK